MQSSSTSIIQCLQHCYIQLAKYNLIIKVNAVYGYIWLNYATVKDLAINYVYIDKYNYSNSMVTRKMIYSNSLTCKY